MWVIMSYEILNDSTRSGRDRPWRTHKTSSTYLAESYARLDFKNKSENVRWCGSSLKFNVCPQGHEKKLSWSNFCRVRLCPMCQWRRSLLVAHQIKLVAHEAVKREKMKWVFLTLTIQNPTGDNLSDSITTLMKAWDRLSKRKEFKQVIGWFRSLEVTRNYDNGTYHPHYHVLLGVNSSYFRSGYITQSQWSTIWQECLRVDYVPIVDVRVVKGKQKENSDKILASHGIEIQVDGSLQKSDLSGSVIAELAKYSTKSDDFLVYNKYEIVKSKRKKMIPIVEDGINEELTDEVVRVMDKSLARRRLYAYGGLLKEIWKELQAEGRVADADDDNADLVHVDDLSNCKCSVCASDMLEELYSWIPGVRQYIKKENEITQN